MFTAELTWLVINLVFVTGNDTTPLLHPTICTFHWHCRRRVIKKCVCERETETFSSNIHSLQWDNRCSRRLHLSRLLILFTLIAIFFSSFSACREDKPEITVAKSWRRAFNVWLRETLGRLKIINYSEKTCPQGLDSIFSLVVPLTMGKNTFFSLTDKSREKKISKNCRVAPSFYPTTNGNIKINHIINNTNDLLINSLVGDLHKSLKSPNLLTAT